MDTLNSPLLRGRAAAGGDPGLTDAESSGLIRLAEARGARNIAVGSGRDARAVRSVQRLADEWRQRGGKVATELTWPEAAASWLRQATRFAAADAEVWIMLGPRQGWAQMTRRLLWSTPWKPAAALLAGALSERRTLDLVGGHNLAGIAGVTRRGESWHLGAGHAIAFDRKDLP